jgi:hypothetical protein
MSVASQQVLLKGRQLDELFGQIPGETYSLLAQQMMLDIILAPDSGANLNVANLKKAAAAAGAAVKTETDYEAQLAHLKSGVLALTTSAQGTTS